MTKRLELAGIALLLALAWALCIRCVLGREEVRATTQELRSAAHGLEQSIQELEELKGRDANDQN